MTTQGELPAGDQTDYKAEAEKLKAENENLKKTSEDLKLEFMSEDYLDFLNNKGVKETPKEEKKEVESLENLTPREKLLVERAKAETQKEIDSKMTDFQKKQKEDADLRTASEVKKFAATHDDFEKFRPVMFGLSLDPKFSDFSLSELYEKAKSHIKSLAGDSDEEKEKKRKSQGEKPGQGTSSFQKGSKKLTAEEANEEAWNEVVGKEGLPSVF